MAKDTVEDARLNTLIDLVQPERRTRVVEVGANPINQNPYAALRDAGHCDVWGFEPGKEAFARLQPGPQETYLPYAVGDGTRQMFHATRAAAYASLLEPSTELTRFWARMGQATTVEDRTEVDTVRLDDMDEVPPFDLLKIDVQGGEMMVYDGAARHLGHVSMIVAEVGFMPLYKDQPLLDAQMVRLREHGFDLHRFLHLSATSLRGGLNGQMNKRKNKNQLLDGDAVFLRSLRAPDALSDEQLKHMAILADSVIASYDVALRCLDHLIERGRITAKAAQAYVAQLPGLAQ